MEKYAEKFFPKEFARAERDRSEALQRRLNGEQIAVLMSIRFFGRPLREPMLIKDYYTPEYAQAMEAGTAPAELAKIAKYRYPTAQEVNLLYCDIHAREKKYDATGGQPQE
ncbi:MAG: hypothetical protein FWD16_05285 [Clostridia bacterium]|nr:hypothetical protein [Clostridia bacterium]